MATINRARSYFIYVLAIVVSAVFSFFGKNSSWAETVTAQQNAKIFQQTLQTKKVEQAGTTFGQGPVHAWVSAEVMPPPDPLKASLIDNLSPVAQNAYITQSATMFKEIEDKAANRQPLSEEDVVFLKQFQNETALTALNNQINALSVQVETLLKLMKDKDGAQ